MKILRNLAAVLVVRFREADSVAQVRALVETGEGEYNVFEMQARSTGAGSRVTVTRPLPIGELIGAECVITSGEDYFGCAAMSLSIAVSPFGAANRIGTIMMGPIGEASVISYPNAPILGPLNSNVPMLTRSFSDPGAGNDAELTLDGFGYIEIALLKFTLTTSATVATRQVTIGIGETAGAMIDQFPDITQTAGIAGDYVFQNRFVAGYSNSTGSVNPIGKLGCKDGGKITISAINLQAGDAFTDIMIYGREYQSLES